MCPDMIFAKNTDIYRVYKEKLTPSHAWGYSLCVTRSSPSPPTPRGRTGDEAVTKARSKAGLFLCL